MPRHASTKSRRRKSPQRPSPRPSARKLEASVQPGKEKKFWPQLIALGALIIVISLSIWYGVSRLPTAANTQAAFSTAATATATAEGILPAFAPTATPVRTWQTFLTFTGGSGTKKTQDFTVPANWLITWSCQGIKGVDKVLNIEIYNPDGSLYNAGSQAVCPAAKEVHDNIEETQSGKVYLSIQSDTTWTINVEKIR